ncbi:PAAR domain-containing protein [Lysobacter changpingensis]|uniref:PAAR domain-containing protein n=1 Tax=Lysobacter changpingensis TaxID=2792784 RepID=UPI001A90A698|nr:PAAR domain-containing protein [Lysobacter changpingensis]
MSERFLCVVGDPTTGGGQALTGAAGFDLECLDGVLRPVVRVGDPVLCGQCGPTQVVSGVEAFWVSGPLVAADGSDLACGHKLVAKLQRGFSVTDGTSARRGRLAAARAGIRSPAVWGAIQRPVRGQGRERAPGRRLPVSHRRRCGKGVSGAHQHRRRNCAAVLVCIHPL